jgi:Uncharacterized protein conserved in bacteria
MEKAIPINIGKNNFVMSSKILSITIWESSAIKKIVRAVKKEENLVINATCGAKTRSVIFLDNGSIVLSYLQPETISARIMNPKSTGNIDG